MGRARTFVNRIIFFGLFFFLVSALFEFKAWLNINSNQVVFAQYGGGIPGGGGPCRVDCGGGMYVDCGEQCPHGGGGGGGGGGPPPCVPGGTTCTACSSSCGSGTQSCSDGCNSSSQACCTSCGPSAPTLSSPSDGSTVGTISPQTLTWSLSGWGTNCSGNSNTFTVYFDTNPDPTTVLCHGSATTSCTTGVLSPVTQYYWKVTADNGYSTSTSSTWSFKAPNSIYGWLYTEIDNAINPSTEASEGLISGYTVNLSGGANGSTTSTGSPITGYLGNYAFENFGNNTYSVKLAVTPTGSILYRGYTNPQTVVLIDRPAIADFPFITVTPTFAPGTPTPTPVFAPIPTNTPTPTPNPLTPTVQPTPTSILPVPPANCLALPTPVLAAPVHQLCTNTKPTFSAKVSDPNSDNAWAHFYSNAYETFSRLGSPLIPPYSGNSQYSPDSYMLNTTGGYWWTAYTESSTCPRSADAPAWLVKMDYSPPPAPTPPSCTLASQDLLSGACTFNCSWPADPEADNSCADTSSYHPVFWTSPGPGSWDPGWVGNQLSTNVVTGSDGQLLYAQMAARDSAGNVSSLSSSGPFICPKLNFSATPPAKSAHDSLISEWKLDEGSGSVAHDSIGLNNGTIRGSPSWTRGQCGQTALSFDGTSNYIDATDTNIPAGSDSQTVAMWFKTSKTLDYNTYADNYFYGTSDSGSYDPSVSGKSLFIGIGLDTNIQPVSSFYTGPYGYTINSGVSVNDGNWHHAVVTYEGATGNYQLYIDGTVKSSGTMPTNIVKTGSLFIGRGYSKGNYWYWDGDLADISVYNKALSDSEVQSLYHAPCVIPTPTPTVITPTPTPGDWIQVQGGDTYQKAYNYPVPLNKSFITNLPGDTYNTGIGWSGLGSWNFGFGNLSAPNKKVGNSLTNTYNFTYFVESLKSKSIVVPNTSIVGTPANLDDTHSVYSYSGLGYYTLDTGFTPKTPVTIFLISGSLEIAQNFTIPAGDTVVFVVNGNIYIDGAVTKIPGLYISSQTFTVALGISKLEVDGMIYANTFTLNRIVRDPNNPTYKFVYQPQYMIVLLPYLGRSQVDWQEVKP